MESDTAAVDSGQRIFVFNGAEAGSTSAPFGALGPLHAEVTQAPGRTVVRLSGDFAGLKICSGVYEMFESLRLSGAARMIVDLNEVSYGDTLAVGILLSLLNTLENEGGGLALSGLPPHLKKIVYQSRLHSRMEIFDTPEEAEEYALCLSSPH